MSVKSRIYTALLIGFILVGMVQDPVTSDTEAPTPEDLERELAGNMVGDELMLSFGGDVPADRYHTSVAYNWKHHEYLVVWHNKWPGNRDIYARRVSESGQILSWFCVATGGANFMQPDVVYNAINDEYLIVWMYEASPNIYEIWGRIIPWNGSGTNPDFQIITWEKRSFWTPRAAWNSYRNEYMVVWNALYSETMEPYDISNAIIRADGTKRYGTILTTTNTPHQADITYNVAADEYLVVWRSMATPENGNIKAARVNGESGNIINPPGVIDFTPYSNDEQFPSVATNYQDKYIVVWQLHVGSWKVWGQTLNINGSFSGDSATYGYSGDENTVPQVAVRPGPGWEFLVAWQKSTPTGEEIWAYHYRDGYESSFPVSAVAFWDNESPSVEFGKVSALIAYEGDSQGDPNIERHIYGRLFGSKLFLPLILR